MPAGKHGSSELTVAYDDAGGTPRTITNFILDMGGMKITSHTDPSTPYGASVMAKLPTGVSEIADMTLEGFFDDTATTGPHTVLGAPDTNPQGATRTLTVVVGNAKTWASEGYLLSYEVLAKAGNLTRFRATICQNSGAWS
jgi:hypothetical protein